MQAYGPEGSRLHTKENQISTADIKGLHQALSRGDILEATALLCTPDHDIVVEMGGVRGIIPREEGALGIKEGTVRDIALITRVGKPVCFTVTALGEEDGRPLAVLSRRNAQERCRSAFINTLTVGDIIPARVTHLESFGAFCDIGCGIVALLPIDAISVSRISHPRDRFTCGDDIRVIVKSIENGRITLSYKELLGTWEENAARFSCGQTVAGIIRSIEEYGIFVELAPNLAGLAEPVEGVFVGQQASVFIKNLIPEKMKAKLVIVDAFDAAFARPTSPVYFYRGDRMDRWVYSPAVCPKQIFTDFTVENANEKGYTV